MRLPETYLNHMSYVNSDKFLKGTQKCLKDEELPTNMLGQNILQVRITNLNEELKQEFKDIKAEGGILK